MRQKNTRIRKIESEKSADANGKKIFAILKRFFCAAYLVFPVGAAFFGGFFSDKIIIFLSKTGLRVGDVTETFKFFVATFLFFISSGIVFILSRSEKPVIEI